MKWQDLQKEWEQRYKVDKEANIKYGEILDKYFRIGLGDPSGRIEWKGEVNVINEEALEEIKEAIRVREIARNNLVEIEQKMFG